MRDKHKPATFGELMGSKVSENQALTMKSLRDMLGPKMPELPANRIGKHRLVNTLRERFGENWRNLPSLKSLISDFEKDIETQNIIARSK